MGELKKGNNKFYYGDDENNPLAKITYVISEEGNIVVEHTVVSETLKGQGIGGQLVERIVEYARQENKKIVPVCTYAKKVLTNNEKYADVLAV